MFVNMYRKGGSVYTFPIISLAGVAKLADALALGASTARYAGSSPVPGTFVLLGLRSTSPVYTRKKYRRTIPVRRPFVPHFLWLGF